MRCSACQFRHRNRHSRNLVPHLRWLLLLTEAIDARAKLGDVRPDVELAVREAAHCLRQLLREVGSPLHIRVGLSGK